MAPPEGCPDPDQATPGAAQEPGFAGGKVRPMFPLGSPLLPTAVLPLHIFEPRYRALARRCTDNDEPFGVVMIERGSEVGGGDVRSDVGCLATISQHQELPDGRWVMLATGAQRIQILEWLPDDPYPQALTADWPDEAAIIGAPERRTLVARLRRLRALASEIGALGVTAAESAAIDDRLVQLAEDDSDPTDWTFRLAALVPAGPFDRHAMLCAPDPARRCDVMAGVLDGVEELLGGR